jgi:uncharacterized protein YegP (UPF0339 family)
MAYKFEIYRDKANEFRVRFRAPNGEKMFSTEGYAAKASARNVIKSIIKNTPKAVIEDLSDLRAKSAATKATKGKKAKAKTKKTKSKKAKSKKA